MFLAWKLALVALLSLGARNVAHADGTAIVGRFGPSIYRLSLRNGADTPESGHCTAFLVSSQGHLLTNEHCVVPVLLHPPLRPWLDVRPRPLPLRIVEIDVRNDLALLRADLPEPLPEPVNVAAGVEIPAGGRYFTFGFPLSLLPTSVEGNVNGIRRSAVYRRLELTGPVNGGASGSPVFSADGNFAGVVWGKLSDAEAVTFATPHEAARALVGRHIGSDAVDRYARESLAENVSRMLDDVQTQFLRLQNDLTLQATQSSAVRSRRLRDWFVAAEREHLQCSSGIDEDRKARNVKHSETCHLPGGAWLDEIGHTATYAVSYEVLESHYDNRLKTLAWMNAEYNEAKDRLRETYKRIFEKESPLLTVFDCTDRRIRTPAGIPFLVNYCLRGYVPVPGLFDLKLKAITLGRPEALVVRLELRGFSRDNAWKMTEAVLGGVSEVRP